MIICLTFYIFSLLSTGTGSTACDSCSNESFFYDAEHAFSGGRLQVNHLQHGMNSQTFKARVALASWVNTPFLPSGTPASIIAEASRKSKTLPAGKSNGKGKALEVLVVDDSDSSGENDF